MENPPNPDELSQDYLDNMREQQQMRQQLQQLENAIRQRMTKEAFERYGNIKSANPQFAVQILLVLSQYIEKTKRERIDDQEFKQLLKQMAPDRKNISIKRK